MIILASGSKSRNEQLRKLNLEFKSQAPDINEDILENESTIALTKRLSYEKALKIANWIKENQLQKDGSLFHSFKNGKSTINYNVCV